MPENVCFSPDHWGNLMTVFLNARPASSFTNFTAAMLAEAEGPDLRRVPIRRGFVQADEIDRALNGSAIGGIDVQAEGNFVRVPATTEIGNSDPLFARPMVENRAVDYFNSEREDNPRTLDLSRPCPTLEQAVFENHLREACMVRGGRWPNHRNADLRAAAEVICNELTARDFFLGYLIHLRAGAGDPERCRDIGLANLRWALVRCRSKRRREMWVEAVGCDLWLDGPRG